MAVYTLDWNQDSPKLVRSGALTIGNFDGVHLGHVALLAEARRQAHSMGGPVVALTFEPHPLQLLRPEQFKPVLTTALDRAELLQSCGADHVILLRTTPELLHLTAADFFQQVILQRVAARALVEGPSFGFGRNREGNIDTLTNLCTRAGLGLTIVPPVLFEEKPVSSSRVRDVLLQGAARLARDLLGRPYRLRGTVATGMQRGRTIGFPTANLEKIETLVPGDGVYAVRVHLDARSWPGAVNIGPNPTFGEQTRKVEVHLIDFQGELLGQVLAVDFLDRLRSTQPFAGVAQLVEQLRRDVDQARQIAGPASGGG
jgi:riboflavin kinase/FMN adenylyltransferase